MTTSTLTRHAGQRLTRRHHWTHQATAVACGACRSSPVCSVAWRFETASPLTLPVTAVIGVVLAVVVLVRLLAEQERR
jgi:hypothetical protein